MTHLVRRHACPHVGSLSVRLCEPALPSEEGRRLPCDLVKHEQTFLHQIPRHAGVAKCRLSCFQTLASVPLDVAVPTIRTRVKAARLIAREMTDEGRRTQVGGKVRISGCRKQSPGL